MATTIRQWVPAAPGTFDAARAQFDRIADRLHLDAATRDLLRSPSREFQFTIPIRMDNGSSRVFRAIRVQHNDARGPLQGRGSLRSFCIDRRSPIRCNGDDGEMTLRDAAYLIAVDPVAKACPARGRA